MPFGMKNSGATPKADEHCHLRAGVEMFISMTSAFTAQPGELHLRRLRALFERLRRAKLSVNLAKSDFGRAR